MQTTALKLNGLHCTSCAVNIDLTLEDLPGIQSSNTNYQKSELNITFDPKQTALKKIIKTIEELGYQATQA